MVGAARAGVAGMITASTKRMMVAAEMAKNLFNLTAYLQYHQILPGVKCS
jgi:hypothetical protein